jgi:putative SOS response-associated peptidase YedK
VFEAGHDRCVIAIQPENIEAWLAPDQKNLAAMYAILDDPVDTYFQHELANLSG